MICLLERSFPLPLVLVPAVGSQPFCSCSGSVKTKILLNETLERNGITGILPSTTAHVHLNGDTWRGQHEGVAHCRCKDTCGNPVPKMWQLHCPSFPSLALSAIFQLQSLTLTSAGHPVMSEALGMLMGRVPTFCIRFFCHRGFLQIRIHWFLCLAAEFHVRT